MKKCIAIFLSFVMVLSLTACGSGGLEKAAVISVNTAQNAPGYVAGEDYQEAIGIYGNNYAHCFTEGEGGYYYCMYGASSPLMFYDINSGISLPVCNQPNCPHEDGNCNAYLGYLSSIEFIQYYDGNLYLFGHDGFDISKVDLYRISADGSTRGKIGTIFTAKGDTVSYNAAVHRGYAYAVLTGAGVDNRKVEVHRLSLSGDGQSEVVHFFDPSYGGIGFLKAYGNYLYIRHCYYADKDGNGFTGDLYRMNIHTCETELVVNNCMYDFVVNDDFVFYNNNAELIAHNVHTNEETVILDNGYQTYLALDGNYLCCDNECGLFLIKAFGGQEVTDPRTMSIIDVRDLSIVKTLVIEDEKCELIALQDNMLYTVIIGQTNDGFFGAALNCCNWSALNDGDTVIWGSVVE